MVLTFNSCMSVNVIFFVKHSQQIGQPFNMKHHYSHTWTMCRYALGIFNHTTERRSSSISTSGSGYSKDHTRHHLKRWT